MENRFQSYKMGPKYSHLRVRSAWHSIVGIWCNADWSNITSARCIEHYFGMDNIGITSNIVHAEVHWKSLSSRFECVLCFKPSRFCAMLLNSASSLVVNADSHTLALQQGIWNWKFVVNMNEFSTENTANAGHIVSYEANPLRLRTILTISRTGETMKVVETDNSRFLTIQCHTIIIMLSCPPTQSLLFV